MLAAVSRVLSGVAQKPVRRRERLGVGARLEDGRGQGAWAPWAGPRAAAGLCSVSTSCAVLLVARVAMVRRLAPTRGRGRFTSSAWRLAAAAAVGLVESPRKGAFAYYSQKRRHLGFLECTVDCLFPAHSFTNFVTLFLLTGNPETEWPRSVRSFTICLSCDLGQEFFGFVLSETCRCSVSLSLNETGLRVLTPWGGCEA